MSDENTWRSEYAIETSATPETIWSIFREVPAWKNWNAGIEQINIDGPFATGTWFTMKPPGEEALRSQLVDVRENVCFVDETRVGDLVILVTPRVGEEKDRVAVLLQIGAHRTCAKLAAVLRHQHCKADLLHQLPGAILIARVVIGHVLLPEPSGTDNGGSIDPSGTP